jgi:hypothetical protein
MEQLVEPWLALTGRSSASMNLCQSRELISKCRASAISCAARAHPLPRMKFVMFKPRSSAPRRMSLAGLALRRTLKRSVRFWREAVVGIHSSSCTYNVHHMEMMSRIAQIIDLSRP